MALRRNTLVAAALVSLLTAGPAVGWVVIDQNGVVNGGAFPNVNAPPFLNAAPRGVAVAANAAPAPAFEPPIASSRVRRTLLQFDALVADRAWDEAIDVVERLQTEHGSELTPTGEATSNEEATFEPIASRCQRLFASLPPEGLDAYRRRVDGTARQWLSEGVARLDARRIGRVVDELFASSEGDAALLALGELALERGDTADARRHWRRLHPELWGPGGAPIGVALGDLAPSVSAELLAEAWTGWDRSIESLPVYPDADTPLADVLARLVVASLREGDVDRAAVELRLLGAIAPDTVGRLAGRDQPLADALGSMLAAEPTSARSTGVPLLRATLSWTEPLAAPPAVPTNVLASRRIQIFRNALGGIERRIVNSQPQPAASPPPLTAQPIVADSTLVFTEGGRLRRLDLITGEELDLFLPGDLGALPGATDQAAAAPQMVDPPPMQLRQGPGGPFVVAPRVPDPLQPLRQAQQRQAAQRAVIQNQLNSARPRVVANTLACADGVLYAVQQRPKASTAASRRRRQVSYSQSLIGVDLRSDDKLVFDLAINDAASETTTDGNDFRFAGAPVVRGDRVYTTLHKPGLRTRVSVGCFAKSTGRRLWLTPIGSGQPPNAAAGVSPLTLQGGTLYVATELGAVVALDAARGDVRWLSRYRRAPNGTAAAKTAVGCLLLGDRVLIAPTDSRDLLAFDATTGRRLWSVERPDTTATLAGVAPGAVVVAGKRLASFDPLTGRQQFLWPESERAGLRGIGSATVVGGEVFWPTRRAVYAFHTKSGIPSRLPIDLSPLGGEGANLVAAGDRLVIAGNRAIGVLGPGSSADRGTPEPRPLLSRLSESESNEQPGQLARYGPPGG